MSFAFRVAFRSRESASSKRDLTKLIVLAPLIVLALKCVKFRNSLATILKVVSAL